MNGCQADWALPMVVLNSPLHCCRLSMKSATLHSPAGSSRAHSELPLTPFLSGAVLWPITWLKWSKHVNKETATEKVNQQLKSKQYNKKFTGNLLSITPKNEKHATHILYMVQCPWGCCHWLNSSGDHYRSVGQSVTMKELFESKQWAISSLHLKSKLSVKTNLRKHA